MINIATQKIIQGALVITLSAGGMFYTLSDDKTSQNKGCIIYKQVDGTTKKLCGAQATSLLKQINKPQIAQKQVDAPTTTASIKSKKNKCLKHPKGSIIGVLCRATLKLENKP